jgi:carbamoyl-phosphate synthase large subunit
VRNVNHIESTPPCPAVNPGPTNVLFTCAGKRNYLMNAFKAVLGQEGRVFAADRSHAAPALQEADLGFVVPGIDSADYVATLVDICRRHKIKLLVPLHDNELPVIAHNRSAFLQVGTFPLVASSEVVDTCCDKWLTYQYCLENHIPTPETYCSLEAADDALKAGETSFPLVIKPRWGSASFCVEVVHDEDELRSGYSFTKSKHKRTILGNAARSDCEHSMLVQQCVLGEELVLDVLNDLNCVTRDVFVKRKLSNPPEGADRIVTIKDEAAKALGQRIGATLRHIGNLDCDVMMTNEGLYLLECNPRFGGGFPFTHSSGVDIPSAILSWLNGQEPPSSWNEVKANMTISKTERLVVCDPAKLVILARD